VTHITLPAQPRETSSENGKLVFVFVGVGHEVGRKWVK